MRIAALVLCHIFPERINRLISSLDDEDIDVYIHIDKKSTLFDEIKSDNGKINILCDELRVDVRWGQFSQVEAELNLLRYASGRKSYDYYLLLSGMDYPLVSTEELKLFLSDNAESNYINLCNSRNNNNNGKSNNHDKCNDIYYLSCLLNKHGISRILRRIWIASTGGYNHTFKAFRRKNNTGFKFYYGSQWWCLSGNTIQWMLEYIEENPKYVAFFRNSRNPDESFFQTLFMNSSFVSTRKDYLHYIDWSEKRNSPKCLEVSDFYKIKKSGKLFARKIMDEQLMDLIDQNLR